VSVREDGSWAAVEDQGTSFASPLVVHGLSEIMATSLPITSTSNVLRAFAVHFADEADDAVPVEEVGFGRMQWDYSQHLTCGPDEVTVLFQDRIGREETIALPIPYPDQVGGLVALTWTVVITSPIAPEDAVEYTRAGLELQFRPHSRRLAFVLPDGTSRIVDVTRDRTEALRLMAEGAQPSANPATRSGRTVRASELTRRDEGKWETVIHGRDSLRGSSLLEPRLDLAYFARDGGLVDAAATPDLDFAVLVTIRTRAGSGLYDRVRAAYPLLTPIALRARIQLDG
jgi:hypothetical protein